MSPQLCKAQAEVDQGEASLRQCVIDSPEKCVNLFNIAKEMAEAGQPLSRQEIDWIFGLANLALQAAMIRHG